YGHEIQQWIVENSGIGHVTLSQKQKLPCNQFGLVTHNSKSVKNCKIFYQILFMSTTRFL
ncbi:MAG: hypothetical protein PUP92_22415, partial [Rhizonema sp. PD38]|nr:hypothetical protein [Rhizonema sp. PD38]